MEKKHLFRITYANDELVLVKYHVDQILDQWDRSGVDKHTDELFDEPVIMIEDLDTGLLY